MLTIHILLMCHHLKVTARCIITAVNFLLDHGIDVDARENVNLNLTVVRCHELIYPVQSNRTPLQLLLSEQQYLTGDEVVEVATVLVERGAEIGIQDKV